jgi:SAM-dependent methyltransferase
MSIHYGGAYDRVIARAGKGQDHWERRRRTILKYKQGGAILDIGCSSGGFLEALGSSAWELFGVEISRDAAQTARLRTGAAVFTGDILDAPFEAGSFDAITCFHVLEHLRDPKKILSCVYEWLKPGGIFYFEIPNIDSLDHWVFRSYWYALELPRHLYHFSPSSLRALAGTTAFSELQMRTLSGTYFEHSMRYIVADMASRAGLRTRPMAEEKQSPLVWRAMRKAHRLTALSLLGFVASACGRGPDLSAVFQK